MTGCYGPLLLGTREIQNRATPSIEVKDHKGNGRLPEEILSLVIPPIAGAGEVLFFNGSETTVTFSWRKSGAKEADRWMPVALAPHESLRFPLSAPAGNERGA